jgi:hypothetical protein
MADEDVTTSDSSPEEATSEVNDAAHVTGETQVTDRPVQNIVGEFNRKLGKIQERFEQARSEDKQKLDAILQYLASAQQATAVRQPAQGQGELSDEDLWSMAQRGDRTAFEEYQRRIASREYQTKSQAERQQTMITSQLNALVTKYPVLRDSNHPLTQHAHQAYQLLVQNGYTANQATLLEAAKTAIADRPDLVSEIFSQTSQAREQVRQTASQRAQTGVTGASHRRAESPAQGKPVQVSEKSADLAKRMGIKDPKGAKERFLKRQETGQSGFGSVAAFVREEDI